MTETDDNNNQSRKTLGRNLEAEIGQQPDVWREIAASNKATELARAIGDRDVVLVGSGSSLFMSQLGAFALRTRGVRAHALAATEAALDSKAYTNAAVIALSQSGRSSDLLDALDVLQPSQLIALTNTPDSPLGARANVTIDIGAGREIAIPATKSVTATGAILLWAAELLFESRSDAGECLIETAEQVRRWLGGPHVAVVLNAVERIARRRSVVILGSGYGVPLASEFALKLKEATYVHAEGFSAGEFRHGSAAMLDAGCAVIGIAGRHGHELVARSLREAARAESLTYTIGGQVEDVPLLGPGADGRFDALSNLVAAQTIALHLGRARGVDSDAPRGLTKALVTV